MDLKNYNSLFSVCSPFLSPRVKRYVYVEEVLLEDKQVPRRDKLSSPLRTPLLCFLHIT